MCFLYTCISVVNWQPCVFIIHRKKKVFQRMSQVCEIVLFLSVGEMLFNLILTSDTSSSQPNIQYTGWLTLVCKEYAHHRLLPSLTSFGYSASAKGYLSSPSMKHYYVDWFEKEMSLWSHLQNIFSVEMLLCEWLQQQNHVLVLSKSFLFLSCFVFIFTLHVTVVFSHWLLCELVTDTCT